MARACARLDNRRVAANEDADTRRQWLPWRPRMRLAWLWSRGIARFYRIAGANQNWFNAHFRGRSLIVGLPLFFLVNFVIWILGVAIVGEITIFPLAASIYAVFLEWVVLLVLCPFFVLARAATRRWPSLPRHRPRRLIWP